MLKKLESQMRAEDRIIRRRNELIMKQKIVISNKQTIIEILRKILEKKTGRIHLLERELDFQKKLVAVYDDSFREALEPKEDAETIGRLVREIAGHTE